MKKIIFVLFILFLAAAVFPDDNFLGEKIVDFKGEKDTLPVTAKKGAFTGIIFKVTGNDVEIVKCVITYGNDKVDDISLKWIFKEGDRSRLIDLEGAARIIKKIEFYYKTVGEVKEGKATVKIWGVHPDDFKKLGEKKIGFDSDKDTLDVTASEGFFKKIIFRIKDNDVEMNKCIITYGNGDKDTIPLKWIFKENDRSRLIDLEGNARVIKKIEFYYKTIGDAKKKASIAVFGVNW
ncbi:MAG: hypothetical protein JXB88_22600 [Spirochaetales bacterium]|nr:hypothetical protein [Spirochaetales bacterium]